MNIGVVLICAFDDQLLHSLEESWIVEKLHGNDVCRLGTSEQKSSKRAAHEFDPVLLIFFRIPILLFNNSLAFHQELSKSAENHFRHLILTWLVQQSHNSVQVQSTKDVSEVFFLDKLTNYCFIDNLKQCLHLFPFQVLREENKRHQNLFYKCE